MPEHPRLFRQQACTDLKEYRPLKDRFFNFQLAVGTTTEEQDASLA